ncbi:MAG TPA: trypsin-like peptidase domain-containing protein [Solirubrobacteraceae bacterium]|jgi:S1-C subfamily serine protease
MKRLFLIPLLSALLGGAIVIGVLAATGDLRAPKEKIVTEIQGTALPETSSSSSNTAQQSGNGLTAHDIYVRDAPAVAYVTSSIEKKVESPFDPFGEEESEKGTATGSGILISHEGLILTNWHVVDEAVKVHVKFSENTEGVEATVIGDNPSQDLALLRVPASAVSKIKPLTLGDSSKVEVGEPVLAIGNPFALARTLTTGIVSALQRRITAPNGFAIENAIQTDAPINPGNSGGPLLNADGEVIGINSQIETGGSGSDGNIGIGFAVPINTAKEELPRLESGGAIKTAYLGVSTVTVDSALAALNLPVHEGALVEEVKPGTPAAKAGLKAGNLEVQTAEGEGVIAGGDIIVGIDGKKVKGSTDLASDIEAKQPGDKVKLEFEHPTADGKYEQKTSEVTLTTRPKSVENPDTPEG